MCYIMSSAVGAEHVPLGKLYDALAEAKAAAHDLDILLPALRLEVIEMAIENLSSQPPEIRKHVLSHLARHL
jgi:hypothetical protein